MYFLVLLLSLVRQTHLSRVQIIVLGYRCQLSSTCTIHPQARTKKAKQIRATVAVTARLEVAPHCFVDSVCRRRETLTKEVFVTG